ncbi:hypothetical protein GCM10011579_008810 [Streptomyces albiflavescens]|uniref:Ada DNA repair metal-binding domain-containing protein n=1 Tax=Streptomyces albiflavescens TaxID=1623582 RepID=A0A917XTV5_9ACTN|nr:hypothetical protein GCM10011579_008810 [Streptomyces albiflavescens]
MDEDTRCEAVRSQDARFDGEFFFAVRTTDISCRPNCPAVTPKRGNLRFFPTAAAAQGSGFRACRRCLPRMVSPSTCSAKVRRAHDGSWHRNCRTVSRITTGRPPTAASAIVRR